MSKHKTVSFDNEPLILVDGEDNVTGYETKVNAHLGNGLLHRAFSIFLFTDDNKVLLQQRSGTKPLWPLYWSNSCCSHPRKGETYDTAVHRRLREELTIDADLVYLYRFRYQAKFAEIGSEHELCSVYVGKIPAPVRVDVNPSEIAAWQWMDCDAVDRLIEQQPDQVTPWFVMEWQRLRSEYRDTIATLPSQSMISAA
ncbi:isopentenyl-diphosphate Delta-isomerase [Thiohalocapsa marina]|uniref:Isopentenyl-diphosphate Delta-isomerase n=1 Tax=Thiohalocapsa marina TaxID=424902 RepID=A0A5M8FNZ2_9GAMM|nr:isopentenyl-diphosphate Delta-isomerase [Thiohalocapsa marina]KAA6186643.1 isopentenyl-diphosphate Delta-isomerase [Thiohalocapsa marina]